MSQPPDKYERIFDFTDFSATQPSAQHPGQKIDQELNAARESLNETIDRLGEIQRDDGKLRASALDTTEFNGIVNAATATATAAATSATASATTATTKAGEATASATTASNAATTATGASASAQAQATVASSAATTATTKAAEAAASADSALTSKNSAFASASSATSSAGSAAGHAATAATQAGNAANSALQAGAQANLAVAAAVEAENAANSFGLSVGTVTTGASGSPATVTVTGSAPAYVLNFGIPAGSAASWGAISGTLSSQTDLQGALDSKANLASPVFSGNVSLTNSSATGTVSVNSGTAPNDTRSSLTSTILKVGELPSNPSAGFSYLSTGEMKVGRFDTGQFFLSTNTTGGATPYLLINQGIAGTSNFYTKIKDGKFIIDPNDGNPEYEPYVSLTALSSYALLSGATFTGKVTGTATATTAAFNIGTVTAAPSGVVNGDIWITDRLAFRNRFGNTIIGLTNNQTNTIATTSDSAFILGITQNGNGGGLKVTNSGTGESLRVEDGSENPDLTPFIVGSDGRVGIHGSPANNTDHKLAIYNGNVVFSAGFGIAFGDGTTLTTAPVAGPTYVDVQVFGGPASSGSFTWTKPTGAKTVEVLMMSGGGGGGSGARQATTAGRFGGGGGGGAGGIRFKLDADALGSSETVIVGAGGAGGVAVTTDSTNGNPGTKGGDSVFGPITCRGGNFGGGGTDITGAAGATSVWYQWISSSVTVNNRGGVAPAAAPSIVYGHFYSATGGGGGASRSANVTLSSGGGAGGNKLAAASGGVESGLTSAIAGGAGGLGGTSVPPVAGTNGTEYWGGTGGGGGYYISSTVGNPGAVGGWPGGGGGGGGCSDNNFNSGAGGAGGNGVVVVITYC